MASNMIGLQNLFGTGGETEIVELPIQDLSPRRNHKFRPSSKAKRDMIAESIKEYGVIQPIIVRPEEDCAYKISGKYEILAGHQRTELCRELGKSTIPCVIKRGLSEEDSEQYVTITNIQRSWEELSYSERASILTEYYTAVKNGGRQKGVLDEINSYLKTYSNPVNSMADEGLSTGLTGGVREVAEEYDLSRETIARYIRVNTLIDGMKLLLDDGMIPFKAAVELSYISEEKQYMFESLMNKNGYKCDVTKAKQIRDLQMKNKLTLATMTDVLLGKMTKKKPGKPKGYTVKGNIIQKYFKDETDEKKIGAIIEEALEQYFKGE